MSRSLQVMGAMNAEHDTSLDSLLENEDPHMSRSLQVMGNMNAELDTTLDSLLENVAGTLRCQQCGKGDKSRNRKQNMRSHVETHLKVSHTCDNCDKRFKSRVSLRMHKSKCIN